MLRQCLALAALKWRLLCRTWTTRRSVAMVLTLSLYGTFGALFSALAALGLFLLGAHAAANAETPAQWLALLDVPAGLFLFFWLWGLLLELQRSDLIDLRKLLHLPVSLRMVYFMNFIASLAGPLTLGAVPAAAGLLAGLAWVLGPSVILPGAALVLAFVLMLAAWAHFVRGWLAVAMENKRRRQVVLTALPLLFVLLGQVPSIISQLAVAGGGAGDAGRLSAVDVEGWFALFHFVFPPAWVSWGLWAAVHGVWATVAGVLAALLGAAALGLSLGHRATLRHYTGAGAALPAAGPAPVTPAKAGGRPGSAPATLRRLPGCGDDTAALAWGFFISGVRHPGMRMQLIMPVCMGALLFAMYRRGAYGGMPGNEAAWLPTAALVWPFLNFGMHLLNVFGGDGNGFRGLMLLPTPRRRFLIAKHLALFPFVAVLAGLFGVAGALLSGGGAVLAGLSLLHVLYLYLAFCAVGCWTSVGLPFRMGRDMLRARSNRSNFMLAGLLAMLVMGVLFTPTGLVLGRGGAARALGGAVNPWAGLAVSLAMVAAAAAACRWSVIHAGDWLHAREARVLETLLRDPAE